MLLWGVANALIQPSLFASASAVPRAELASGSAVLATARQLGSALGVAVFVAVLGARPATGLAGFERAWIVVVITAAMTAFAGLAVGRRLTGVPEVAGRTQTTGDALQARLRWNPARAATCRSAWVSTPPVTARVSTMVMSSPSQVEGWHAPAGRPDL